MKDNGIEIINIFQNEDDDKKREIVTQKMQKIINSQINANPITNIKLSSSSNSLNHHSSNMS